MTLTIRLALRDWDYLTPLLLGDLQPDRFILQIDRVGTLVDKLAEDPRYEGGEVSLSRYAQSCAAGTNGLVGVPHFLMRGFRHRCIVAAKSSPLTRLDQLGGTRIGVTGWQDSGNTWTRALLRRAGVGTDDVRWFAGRLTTDHPITDRLGRFAQPGRIEAAPGERPLMDMLDDGTLDAVFTPFMPPGFFAPESRFRPFLPDYPAAEAQYCREVGYVPGIHLLALRPAIAAAHPWLAQALSEVLDESARIWLAKREKYADTTPWIIDELARVARGLPPGWDANGFAPNEAMIDGFCAELHAQAITVERLAPRDLFPA